MDSLDLRLSKGGNEDQGRMLAERASSCSGDEPTAGDSTGVPACTTNPLSPPSLPRRDNQGQHCGVTSPLSSLINDDIVEHHKCGDKERRRNVFGEVAHNERSQRQTINGSDGIRYECSSAGSSQLRRQLNDQRRQSQDKNLLDWLLGAGRRRRWLLPLIQPASAIRLVRLDVPQSVPLGQTARLRCVYDAKNDKLQSLSWYKNGREFYRYQPSERRQPVLVFNATGVQLDISRSRNSTITLVNTTAETSGRYKCEVTGTSFQEARLDAYMDVIPANPSRAHSSATYSAILTYGAIFVVNYLQYLQIK